MNIGIVLYHHVHELDVVSCFSSLHAANTMSETEALNIYTLAKARNSVETSSGLVITPHWAFMSAPEPDILIVPGGKGVDAACKDRMLTGYLKRRLENVRLAASISTGAFILGELGCLRGLNATTWSGALERLRDYDVAEVVTDEPVVKNERVWLAAGPLAGASLGGALVEQFLGDSVAQKVRAYLS